MGLREQRHWRGRARSESWMSPKRRQWVYGKAGQLALLTDWLRLELGSRADLAKPLAVEGCQSDRIGCLGLQAHDGDNALHVGCWENTRGITKMQKPPGEMVQQRTVWQVLSELNRDAV